MIHDHLTDYQIAAAFGDTLSLIYKDKMQELNEDLLPAYNHLDSLACPQYSEFDRWFAAETIPDWAKEKFRAIEHIQKIRRMYKKIKTQPEEKGLDIEKAKAVPIESLYPFKFKGKNVSCPWHDDKSPSMSLRNNRYYCFQCGAKGSTIDFVMRLNNLNFKEACDYLSKM